MSARRICTVVGVFLAAALTVPIASGADKQADEILRRVQKKYDAIKDATVEFTQHVVFGVTQAEQSFSGTLQIKKKNMYRVALEQQTIVTDGSSVWSYSKIDNQVMIDRYRDDPRSFSPEKILVNVPDQYESTSLGKEKLDELEASVVRLTPKEPRSSDVRSMKVWVDEKDWLIRKIQVLDRTDNLITYLVRSMTLNSGLADSVFRFTVPDNAEVIDLR
jgi:outer membrane lipoprotein carrier protein